jgi:hypothetical protein
MLYIQTIKIIICNIYELVPISYEVNNPEGII